MRSDLDFETLVHTHHAALFRFALSVTRHEADASDLVQETFLRWAEKGHQLADPTKVKSWLFTTLYREATGRRRRILRFPEVQVEEHEIDLPLAPAVGPETTDASLAREAVDRLDEAYRSVVTLFYLEDYSYPEIAEILGIPMGTVKSRLARGLAQLQARLQPGEGVA